MKIKNFLILPVLLVNICLWSGGSQEASSPEPAAVTPDTSLTIVDALGREVTLKEPPRRIVQAGSSAFIINDALFLFPEAAERVAAIADSNQGRGYFLPHVDELYGQKTILSRRINMEEILAARPDLVIMKDFLFSQYDQEFQKMGIPVVYLNLESPEGWDKDLVTLGEVFGNPERAEELRTMFQERISRVTEAVSASADEDRALILYYSEKDGTGAFQVPPLTFIQTTMLEMAGAEPVWKDADLGKRWTKVSFEQIASWNPDLIFLISYRTGYDEIFTMMENSGYWNELNAYRNGEVYPFPMDYHSWDQPDPRWLLGLQWMAGTLNGEAFADMDMDREARTFFKEFYNMNDASYDRGIEPVLEGLR